MEPSIAYYEEIFLDFPPVATNKHEWVNIHDGQFVKESVLKGLVAQYIDDPEVIIVVHADPGIAVRLPTADIVPFISRHILKGEIQIADLKQTSLIAIHEIGVATAYHTSDSRLI